MIRYLVTKGGENMNKENKKELKYQCIVGYTVQDKLIEQVLNDVDYIRIISAGEVKTMSITEYLENDNDIVNITDIFDNSEHSEHFKMSTSRRKELLFIKFYANS